MCVLWLDEGDGHPVQSDYPTSSSLAGSEAPALVCLPRGHACSRMPDRIAHFGHLMDRGTQ